MRRQAKRRGAVPLETHADRLRLAGGHPLAVLQAAPPQVGVEFCQVLDLRHAAEELEALAIPCKMASVRSVGNAIANGQYENAQVRSRTGTCRRPSGKSAQMWPKSASTRCPGSWSSGMNVSCSRRCRLPT
jgi:hypothetical protein